MNIHENVATQAIATFFYQEPLWKKKILFDFLLKPFGLAYEDVQDVETQDNLKDTIPDFTIVLKDQKRIKFEVKINDAELTESERNKQKRDAFLVRRNYSHKDEIPLKDDKILYWEDLFKKIYEEGAKNEFSRLILVREYIHADTLHLTPLEVAMLYSPETIKAVYSLSEKVLKLCEGFLETHTKQYEYKNGKNQPCVQQDMEGVGYWFWIPKKVDLFIGMFPIAEKAEYLFSICLCLDRKNPNIKIKDDWNIEGDYAYFPLDKEILAKYEDDEKLQEAFNKNAESVLNEIFGSKSKGAKSV